MNDLKGIIEDCNKSDLVSDKIIKKIIEIIGQEEWQDLHDENSDICTTMGELIITLNRIAELEKVSQDLSDKFDYQVKQVMKLEKENAEVWGQLTNAKRLLKILIEDYVSEPEVFSDGSCEDNKLCNLIKEAEQFLRENSTYERIQKAKYNYTN